MLALPPSTGPTQLKSAMLSGHMRNYTDKAGVLFFKEDDPLLWGVIPSKEEMELEIMLENDFLAQLIYPQ